VTSNEQQKGHRKCKKDKRKPLLLLLVFAFFAVTGLLAHHIGLNHSVRGQVENLPHTARLENQLQAQLHLARVA
jgi:hypothetical protein